MSDRYSERQQPHSFSRPRDQHYDVPTQPGASRPAARSRRHLLAAAISLLILVAIGGGFAYGVYVLHVSKEAEKPLATAASYCNALKRRNYDFAYALLTPELRQQITYAVYTLSAHDSDVLDGNVRGCSVPTASFSDGFTFDPNTTRESVTISITRETALTGRIAVTKVNGAWLVSALDPALTRTDVGALVAAQQFCASLVAKHYAAAYQNLAASLRGQIAQAALAPMFGATSVTALSSCQPTISSYTLAAAKSAATVRATLKVKITNLANPRTISLPITLTLAHASAWQIAGIALTPGGMTPAQTTTSLGAPNPPTGAPAAPALTADEAILINPATNQVYFARNADHPHAMASTTKIMTALVALTAGKLDQKMTVGADAYALEDGIASVAWLKLNDSLTLRDLLYALLLPSGDDAAVVIADGIAGSQPAFVALMNMEAGLLGLTNTHYANVHGLDAVGHESSARDLAVLAEFAMRFPAFTQTVATPHWNESAASDHHSYSWDTTNLLLPTMSMAYAGVTGIKTGYTGNAGGCLVFSATRNGHQLLGVVLGEPAGNTLDHIARFNDAAALLTWGFHLEGQS